MTRFPSLFASIAMIAVLSGCTNINLARDLGFTASRSKVIYAKDGRTRWLTKNAPTGTTAGYIENPQILLIEERTGGGRTTLHWLFSSTYDNRRGTHGFSKNSSAKSQTLSIKVYKDIPAPGRDRKLRTLYTYIPRGRCARTEWDEDGVLPANFFDEMDYFTLSWEPRFVWAKNACP